MMVTITNLIIQYGYAGMFIVVFLETSFVFPLPGDSLLFTAGIFASQGKFGLSYPILLVVFFTSSFLGSILGYEIGYHSIKLRKIKIFAKILDQKHIDKVHAFYEKYGKATMLLSRFVPIVRTFAPITAGMGGMRYGHFLKYNFFGAIIWSVGATSVGFYLGRLFPGIGDYLSYVVILVILISIAPAFVHWMMSRRKK